MYSTFYSNSDTETVIHGTEIDSILESIYSTIMKKYGDIMQKAQVGLLIQ